MIDVKKITLLPAWHMIEKHPAFYDLDSKTAVGQTARLYGAMKELQEVYIEWSNKANATITAFINDVNADQDEFINSINKIMHDYIAMIDEKIKMQDEVIEENITYIKENMIQGLQEILNQMVESGELDAIVLNTFNELNDRVLNLEKAKTVKSVDEMKALQNLEAGNIITTIGYYSANDGGGATYLIREKTGTDIEDNGAIHFINDSLVAELVVNNTISVKQFGAKGDGKTDDTTKIQNAIKFGGNNNYKIFISDGTYKITQSINIPFNTIIEGQNMSSTILDIATGNQFALINGNSYDYQKRYTIIRNIKITSSNYSNGIYTYSGILLDRVYMIKLGRAFERAYDYIDFIKFDNVYANYCEPSDNNGCVFLNGDGDATELNQVNIGSNNEKFGIVIKHSYNTAINNSIFASPVHFIQSNVECNNCHCEGYSRFIKLTNSMAIFNNLFKWKRHDGVDFEITGSYNDNSKLTLNNMLLHYYPQDDNYISEMPNLYSIDEHSDISLNHCAFFFRPQRLGDKSTTTLIPFALPFNNENPFNYISCKSLKDTNYIWKKPAHGGSVYYTPLTKLPFKGTKGNYDFQVYLSPTRKQGIYDTKFSFESKEINEPLLMQIQRNQNCFAHIYYKLSTESTYRNYACVPITTNTLYFDGLAINGVLSTNGSYELYEWKEIRGFQNGQNLIINSDNEPQTNGEYTNGDIWNDNGFIYVRKSNKWALINTTE